MNQRLVWNFELSTPAKTLPAKLFVNNEADSLKWETRYFWPSNEIIVLNSIDPALLNLFNYDQKRHDDYYYLLPNSNHNIKRRQGDLFYKPLSQYTDFIFGYEKKINLSTLAKETINNIDASLHELAQEVTHKGLEAHVKKDAFVYKFSTKPSIKLELSRLEVFNQVFFSLCIEGKSRLFVETIAKCLLRKQVSCDYVSFLKNIRP